MAQPVSSGAIPFGGGLCAGRSSATQSSAGNGSHLQRGRCADRAVAARRAAHHYKLHRSPIAYAARRIRRGRGSAQRLGPGPGEPVAEVHSAAARAARHHHPRAFVRRRFDWASRARAGARIWRGRGEAGRVLTRARDSVLSMKQVTRSVPGAVATGEWRTLVLNRSFVAALLLLARVNPVATAPGTD